MRAIRDFVDQRLTARTIVVVTILILVASWIYPPWIIGSGRDVSHDWFFVFDTTRETVMRVDFGRLFLIDGIILAAGGLLAWAVFHNSTTRRATVQIALSALFVPPLVAVVCLAVVLIKNLERTQVEQAAKHPFVPPLQETLGKRFQLGSNAAKALEGIREARQEGYSDSEIYSYLMRNGFVVASTSAAAKPISSLRDIEELFSENASTVAPDDLKKITLFDVGPTGPFRGRDSWNGCYGRVRNDLPRSVEKIGLKASFYNAQEELIEVRTFWMNVPSALPNTPVSFESNERVDHLPYQWRYQLEVIEAHYVK